MTTTESNPSAPTERSVPKPVFTDAEAGAKDGSDGAGHGSGDPGADVG